jgi:hypothetical protein
MSAPIASEHFFRESMSKTPPVEENDDGFDEDRDTDLSEEVKSSSAGSAFDAMLVVFVSNKLRRFFTPQTENSP